MIGETEVVLLEGRDGGFSVKYLEVVEEAPCPD
jgi:hypothetical protein